MPKDASGEYVAAMEDILNVYQQPSHAAYPQVCLDETSKQLMAQTRPSVPMTPGQVTREDFEYERKGTCRLFLACEPLTGKCVVQACNHHSRLDWAAFAQLLLDVHYPQAQKVVLIMDNLNTHSKGSLYEAFPPEEAERLGKRLEIHYTPKHGSWLNRAEIELCVLGRQCLDRRLADLEEVQTAVCAWQHDHNQAQEQIDWRFTTADARIKLKRLYPVVKGTWSDHYGRTSSPPCSTHHVLMQPSRFIRLADYSAHEIFIAGLLRSARFLNVTRTMPITGNSLP